MSDDENSDQTKAEVTPSTMPGAEENSVSAGLSPDGAGLDETQDSADAVRPDETADFGSSGVAATAQEGSAVAGKTENEEGPRIDANANAAFEAACMAFGTKTDQLTMTIYWLAPDGDYIDDSICEAAAFIRQWPDAPLDALPIHLKRAGFDVAAVGPREKAAWTVFRAALIALDACTAELAAIETPPAPLTGGGMGTIGLRPAPGPFEATGFSTVDD